MSLFASTSPSYLILRSLDALNATLAEDYPRKLAAFSEKVEGMKERLAAKGYTLLGREPLKLTVRAKAYGYLGTELADLLSNSGIVCEFSDQDFLTLMLAPEIGEEGLAHLERAMSEIPPKAPIRELPPPVPKGERVLSLREGMLTAGKEMPIEECEGRILADAALSCPPAIPILTCGERITAEAIACFRYYGVECVRVKEG